MGRKQVVEIQMIGEETFDDLTTYPTITTLDNHPRTTETRVIFGDGRATDVRLSADGHSWLPKINGVVKLKRTMVLGDIALRVSCGVATGADSVFVRKAKELSPELKLFAYPTISGAHRNKDARFDDLNDTLLVLHDKRPEAVKVATVMIGTAQRVLNVPDRIKPFFRGQ
jgi:hypothetical protein